MERPRLKAHYAVEVIGTDQIYLLTEDRHCLVSGGAAVAVLPYLDGEHTVPDIAVALVGRASPAAVMAAVRKFEAGGHLAEGRPDLPAAEIAYWDAIDIDPATVLARRAAARVAVIATGSADVGPFLDALDAAGIAAKSGEAADADLTVVVVDDYLDPSLAQLNRDFVAAGRTWLPVKPGGLVQWVGPVIHPGRTGCWQCMRQRIVGNRQVERHVQEQVGSDAPFATSRGALPGSLAELSGLVAVEVTEVLATGTSWALDDTLLTIDRRTRETAKHTVVRQPQCAACGDARLVTDPDPRVTLQAHPVEFSSDNGFRVYSSAETRERLERHISPVLGAISSLGSLAGNSDGLTYSFGASHDFPMGSQHVELLRKNVRGQSGGKGRTETQARVSAMAEAIERYSGIWNPDFPVTRASFTELGPERAVRPEELLLYSPAQYEHRAEWNAVADLLQTVPEPFDAGRAIDWTTAWSLTHDRPRLVPSAYVWFGHPDLRDHFFTLSDANGNAAGNVLEEAILQGFCELIERDCVATWWYNRIRRPGIDLDALDDPYIETIRRFYAGMGRDIWMLDITSDFGIPAFAAVSRRNDHPVEDIVVGFGAHPSAEIAMMRALTEVNQFLPFITERDEQGNTAYPEDSENAIIEWLKSSRVDEEPWLRPDESVPLRRPQDFPSVEGATLDGTVRDLVARAERAGLEVLVVDQSRPELDLRVAKVIVPGLRHFWRRLGPGRLYDVPVQLGWLDAPIPEDQLNPKSVFF